MAKIPFFRSEKIAEDSYMITYDFTDDTMKYLCYLVTGNDYALLIDTMIGFGDLREYCSTLTDKPVKVVNTHAHFDHIGGNFHFDHCFMHHRDIGCFNESLGYTREQLFELAKQSALPQYRDVLELDSNFADIAPMKVYPVYDGDVFDTGGHEIEVIDAGGHTAGSIVLLDHRTRIAYSGDACNSNTLLEFPNSLPIITYLRNLLDLKERQCEFDMMYGGHEVLGPSVIDEAIETVSRVIAGTDARCERDGLMGSKVYYAAQKVENGYERTDGKIFNMSYLPEDIFKKGTEKQIIRK